MYGNATTRQKRQDTEMRYGLNRKPDLEIVVEYDKGTSRATKLFVCPYKSRSFYVAKFKAGRNPQITAKRV